MVRRQISALKIAGSNPALVVLFGFPVGMFCFLLFSFTIFCVRLPCNDPLLLVVGIPSFVIPGRWDGITKGRQFKT